MKTCKTCQIEKPEAEYYKHNGTKDRLTPNCKECFLTADKARRAKQTPEQRSQRIDRDRRWAEEHPERTKEIKKRSAVKLRDRHNEQAVEYYWRNVERVRKFYRDRYQQKKANGGSHTEAEWLEMCELLGDICLRCRQEKKLTKDHVVPIGKGGGDGIDNLQPLCASCNASKGASDTDYRP
jgi:5-methylcytosine-specific restriction endonuclease McrA